MKQPTYPTFDSYDHVDSDSGEISFPHAIVRNACPICGGRFVDLMHQSSSDRLLGLSLCGQCGWWHLHQDFLEKVPEVAEASKEGTPPRQIAARWWELHHAALTRIDLGSDELSIEALRAHLARYWDQRIHISAQQAEDLVGSVLRERHGGEIVRLTANANAADGGVDLIVVSDGGRVSRAVQVKRRLTRDVESVQEVRNFVGAMVLQGQRQGTFVTTASRFSRAAQKVAMNPNLGHARLSLELIDGEQLLELLEHSAMQGELALPPAMSLDQTWVAPGGERIGAREMLLGDIRKLAPLIRQAGPGLPWPEAYSTPLSDFERDFRPLS